MAGVRPGCVGVCGSGVMLRVSGCALLFSYVRNPRLPMLDERPPADAPARASAMAGANTRLAQKNSANMMRHFGSGLAVALFAQNLRSNFMRVDMGRVRAGGSTAEPNIAVDRGLNDSFLEWCRAYRSLGSRLLDWATTRAQIMSSNILRDRAPHLGLVRNS